MPEQGRGFTISLPHNALRFVGTSAVVFAGLGLWYNATTLFASYAPDPSTPYFLHALYAMSAICVACYLLLVVVGIRFIQLKPSVLHVLIGLMIFEVVYFFGVGTFAMDPKIGLSVGAAAGVANGGLMFQFLTLFPLWGPLLARWAKKRMEAGPSADAVVLFPDEQVDRLSDWAWATVGSVAVFLLSAFAISLAWSLLSPGTMPPAYATFCAPALLGVVNGVASVRRRRRRRRQQIEHRRAARLRAGLCPRCEYNLTGNVSGVCPECGEALSDVARQQRGC